MNWMREKLGGLGRHKVNFLFMDDSFSRTTHISSLTGIIVPVGSYPSVCAAFYESMRWHIQDADGIRTSTELHGIDFLRNAPDEKKLSVLRSVVSGILKHKLGIYRVGYVITDEIETTFASDKKLLGTLWISLLSMMTPRLRSETIIPVMDGFDKTTVRHFSSAIKRSNEMRALGYGDVLTIRDSHNVLGEVFYADSEYSALTQMADTVSLLRNVSDRVQLGLPLSLFKEQMAAISSQLSPSIIWEELISLVLDGKLQGPMSLVRPVYGGNGPSTRAARITPSDTTDLLQPPDP